ncbi:TIR domain-containing anti-phage reverse transcriptase [Pseudohoeflea suaedae]|uniref:TIR domain-containing anti-phage reverse transcriptase n=1 Tax=Pseudohoeflea suaedae TaxID=877384 RepID=UPI001304FC8F|nr:TIR domain-containing anti-phage reverse transcriptase [Pseudohoeflea suaedae]
MLLPSEEEKALFSLQYAHSIQDVAFALGLDPAKFFYVVKNCDSGEYYKSFTIPKKNGGERKISKPLRGLALAQVRLLIILKHVYKPKGYVKSYVEGESFLTNANYHSNQKWVLNFDIEDFFGTITFPRVRGLFMSKFFGFNPRVSTILARICTHEGSLPQGAPTSPILSNIIGNALDKNLVALAREYKLKYTRYADDITFSSSQKLPPGAVISLWEPKFGKREITLGKDIREAVKNAGFRINPEKTRIQFPYERQVVTGLVVNKKANIRRADIARLRMKIHSAQRFGAESAAKVWLGPNATASSLQSHIEGHLSYVRQVRGKDDVVLAKLCKSAIIAGLANATWMKAQADMVREFDVFLSHASEDKEKYGKLNKALKAVGVKTFFDVDVIQWGDSIPEKVNFGLLKSDYFIPFLSNNFTRKGWTNKELNSAISININRKGRILPIIDSDFSVDDNYPILAENLYKKWPEKESEEDDFIEEICAEITKRIVR